MKVKGDRFVKKLNDKYVREKMSLLKFMEDSASIS